MLTRQSRMPREYDYIKSSASPGPCPLCEGHEIEVGKEIEAIRRGGAPSGGPGWDVRTIAAPEPVLQVEGDLGRRGIGMYDAMNSVGANELIVESPRHDVMPQESGEAQMARVFSMYRSRIQDLERDARLRYIFIYKNHGKAAGARFGHPHSELVATPIIPHYVKGELDAAKSYYSYKERCVFCDVINEEDRMGARVIKKTRHFISFAPYSPAFPFEFWVIPLRHHCAFQEIAPDELQDLAGLMTTLLKRLSALFPDVSYNYILHTAPNRVPRKDHWHTLGDDYHWHIEAAPRLLRFSGVNWGAGLNIIPTSPEDAARLMREG